MGADDKRPETESKGEGQSPVCLACGKEVRNPGENNKLGEEFICSSCRDEMLSSLEGAWKRHSAFLDSALN